MQNMSTGTGVTGDAISLTVVIGTIIGWLPRLAAALSVVWLALNIYSWIINEHWRQKK